MKYMMLHKVLLLKLTLLHIISPVPHFVSPVCVCLCVIVFHSDVTLSSPMLHLNPYISVIPQISECVGDWVVKYVGEQLANWISGQVDRLLEFGWVQIWLVGTLSLFFKKTHYTHKFKVISFSSFSFLVMWMFQNKSCQNVQPEVQNQKIIS